MRADLKKNNTFYNNIPNVVKMNFILPRQKQIGVKKCWYHAS